MECGVGDLLKRHFLMCVSSTPMPPPIRTRHLPPVTESMSRRKNERMNSGYVRWSTHPLLHLFLGHRRNGERGNLFLQTTGLHAWSEVGPSILHHTLVAKVSSDLFPHPLSHPSSMRSKILSRPRRPPPSSHRSLRPILHFNHSVSLKFPYCFVYTISLTFLFSFLFHCIICSACVRILYHISWHQKKIIIKFVSKPMLCASILEWSVYTVYTTNESVMIQISCCVSSIRFLTGNCIIRCWSLVYVTECSNQGIPHSFRP